MRTVFFLIAIFLLSTTSLYAQGEIKLNQVGFPSWSYVRPLAWVSLAHHRDNLTDAADPYMIEKRIMAQGEELLEEYYRSPYAITKGRYGRSDFVWCSYSTNEITINWNAPMVYLTGALEVFKN